MCLAGGGRCPQVFRQVLRSGTGRMVITMVSLVAGGSHAPLRSALLRPLPYRAALPRDP